jgi:hypothetical protein
MLLVFVLVGIHSIYALHYCYCVLFVRLLYLRTTLCDAALWEGSFTGDPERYVK